MYLYKINIYFFKGRIKIYEPVVRPGDVDRIKHDIAETDRIGNNENNLERRND